MVAVSLNLEWSREEKRRELAYVTCLFCSISSWAVVSQCERDGKSWQKLQWYEFCNKNLHKTTFKILLYLTLSPLLRVEVLSRGTPLTRSIVAAWSTIEQNQTFLQAPPQEWSRTAKTSF
jgi:hypothetical protein